MGITKKLYGLYRDMSIKYKILLLLYIQIILSVVILGTLSYKFSSEIIYNKSIDYSKDILRTIELRLNDFANNLDVLSQDLLYDNNIYNILNLEIAENYHLENELLSNNRENNEINPLSEYENNNLVNNTLKKMIFSRNEIQSICIVSNSGQFYSADNNSKKVSIKEATAHCLSQIRNSASAQQGKGIWYMDGQDKYIDNVFYARAINNRDSFEEIGIIIILVKKEMLESYYQDLLTQDMQNIAIMTMDNKQIASRSPANAYLFDEKIQAAMQGDKGSMIDKENNILISYVALAKQGWRVASYIALKDLFSDINVLRKWIILLSGALILFVSAVGIFMSLDIVNPINKLVKGMNKLKSGGELGDIEIDRKDELGYLNNTFNEMAREINYLVNCIYREQITRKDAEIKALQSQINPHFLFNTLESINWMAQLNNVPEISDTVVALSALMEASIGRDDKLITLKEEFSYIDNYILILKQRFEDRITLVKNADEQVLRMKIPRLLIQPLIENAIYHGIERSRSKGIIKLDALIVDNEVVIEVMDNGAGISEEELDILNEKLKMDNDTYFKKVENSHRKSIGIENVNRRIKLFYGENYGLTIESKQFTFTRVTVRIPTEVTAPI